MTDATFVHRTPPNDEGLVEAAKAQPGGWVYDIDWDYPETQRTPPEAIRGGWQVGADGRLTGVFSPNERYRAVERCDRTLKSYMHAGARTNKSQWIVDIDERGEALFPNIPEHLIRGWWYVDDQGLVTDRFRPNSRWIDDPKRPAEQR